MDRITLTQVPLEWEEGKFASFDVKLDRGERVEVDWGDGHVHYAHAKVGNGSE